MTLLKKNLLLTCLIATSYGLAGCGGTDAPPKEVTKIDHAAHDEDHDHKHGEKGHSHDHGQEKTGNSHGGWWCDEHGVPEAECGLCDAKVAAAFKKKGDWCKEHDRPDSQCFICHPEKLEEYAAKYEAKYGKKPPKPELN